MKERIRNGNGPKLIDISQKRRKNTLNICILYTIFNKYLIREMIGRF